MPAYTRIKCEICGQEISKSNMSKHLRRHEKHPETFKTPAYRVNHEGLECQFCGKTCKNQNSLRNHERLCKYNPDKQINSFVKYNAEVSKGIRIAWNKGLTKDTDYRVANQSKTFKERFAQGLYERHSSPNSKTYCSRYKYGTYKGYYCDSSWELAFLIYHLDMNHNVQRNSESFDYITTEGLDRKFFPDFKIEDTFYEIKGGYDKQAECKLKAFPKDLSLEWISTKEIQFYIDYAKSRFGRDFYTIYDRNYPSWMDKNASVV